jgi:hypothetical protein
MIAETIDRSYPAVLCVQCSEPVRVPARVVSLQNEIEKKGTDLVFAFTARCELCESKEVYLFSDIQRFEGEPKRSPKTRTVGA